MDGPYRNTRTSKSYARMLGLDVEYAAKPVIIRIRTPIISYHFPNFYLANEVNDMLGNDYGRER